MGMNYAEDPFFMDVFYDLTYVLQNGYCLKPAKHTCPPPPWA